MKESCFWRGSGEAESPPSRQRGVYGCKKNLENMGSQNNFPNHSPVQAQAVAKNMLFTMMVSISWEVWLIRCYEAMGGVPPSVA